MITNTSNRIAAINYGGSISEENIQDTPPSDCKMKYLREAELMYKINNSSYHKKGGVAKLHL